MCRPAFLPFLLAAASCCAFGSVDPELLALVPPGAKLISGVDLERAKSSQFGQYVIGKMHVDDPGFAQFVQDTGFDPRHDLQQILFASAGPQSGADSKVVVLARGNFAQDRIRASARKKGFAPQSVEGVELLVNKQEKGPNTFAFLGNGIGLLGDLETVKQIVSSHSSGGMALDPAVQAQVSKTGAENDAWFVSFALGTMVANHLNHLQPNGAQPGGDSAQPDGDAKPAMFQAQALESVRQASGGISFGDAVRVSFHAVTRSPKDATSLADAVRFFASMIQMEREKDPRAGIAASALDNMNLRTEGEAMHLSLSLPERSLEQLMDGVGWSHAQGAGHAQ